MTLPLVSCLCVTEGRPEFMPWLLWNFERQTYARRELVIIDSSVECFRCAHRDVRIVGAAVGTNIPSKRNRALEEATGTIIAWFDDDDWQHPERLERLVAAIGEGHAIAGVTQSWFVDLFEGRSCHHSGRQRVLFNGAGFAANVARSVRFDERLRRASDTAWLRELRSAGHASRLLDPAILSVWLCHHGNISNPNSRRQFTTSLGGLRSALGAEAWADTDQHLAALKVRLTSSGTQS